MGYPHVDAHRHAPPPSASQAFRRAVAVTIALIVVKGLGAWWGLSLALGADAGHSLGDVGSLAMAAYADRHRHQPPTNHLTFGWGRLEVLMGLANALVLWGLAAAMVWGAVQYWQQPAANALIMAGAAVLSLGANAMLAWSFRAAGDLNRRSTFWHLATDSAGSFGVLVAAGLLEITGWTPINALVTLLIAALMFWGGWGVVRDTVRILLEAAPAGYPIAELTATLEGVKGVDRVHDLHVWTVSSDQPALACHVTLRPGAPPAQDVLCRLHDVLAARGIDHSTIQIETATEVHAEPAW